jgi:hypothetical protein
MIPLRAKIIRSGDHFLDQLAGEMVTVTAIRRHSHWDCEVTFDNRGPVKKVFGTYILSAVSFEALEPIPEIMALVPESHQKSLYLKQVWVFGEARSDAWCRDQRPPDDPAKYREEYGRDWEDTRVFKVERSKW